MIAYQEFVDCYRANVCTCHHKPVCPVCRGSGEVDAGITYTDKYGEIRIAKNPCAGDFVLSLNPLVNLWSIVICGKCHGTGMPDPVLFKMRDYTLYDDLI